jgi:hypothetical protein
MRLVSYDTAHLQIEAVRPKAPPGGAAILALLDAHCSEGPSEMVDKRDPVGQALFIAWLFGLAA